MRPFVDYYRAHDISPVSQDVSDALRHASRREALYRLLGIPASFVRGKRILELGPGSGHNAAYTASLSPERYVLVEANPRGLRETQERLSDFHRVDICVVDSLVEDFRTDERFDLVLAENIVPGQREPAAFLRGIAEYTVPGGIIVCTTNDAISIFAEAGRRALGDRVAPPGLPLGERVARLAALFASHVATLPGMSRPIEHWVLDNLTQPWVGSLFSAPEAIAALAGTFEYYGGSPHVLVDWRWYKDLVGDARRFNERATEAYRTQALNLLDCRETLPPHDSSFGTALGDACGALYREIVEREAAGTTGEAASFRDAIERVRELTVAPAPRTAEAIAELLAQLTGGSRGTEPAANLAGFWGRGTQYLSFIRRAEPHS